MRKRCLNGLTAFCKKPEVCRCFRVPMEDGTSITRPWDRKPSRSVLHPPQAKGTSNSLHEMTRSGPLVRLFIPKELSSSPQQPPYPGIMAGITLPLGATAPKKHESRLTNENCRYHCPHILHFSRLAISAPGEVWPRSSEGPAGPASGRGHHSILPCQGVFEADGGIQEARGEATCWQQALIGFVAGPFRSPESIVTVTL